MSEFATENNSCWRPGLRLVRKGGDQTCVVCGSWACHDELTCSPRCRRILETGQAGFRADAIKTKWVYHYRCAECGREGWFAGRSRVYCSTACANARVGARRRDNPRKLAYVCAWCAELRTARDGEAPRQFCRPDCRRRYAQDLRLNPALPVVPAITDGFRQKWKETKDWQERQALARRLRLDTAQAIVERESYRAAHPVAAPAGRTLTFEEWRTAEDELRSQLYAATVGPGHAARARRILEDEGVAETALEREADEFQEDPAPEAGVLSPPPDDDPF